MGGTSVRARAFPVAIALGLVSLAGMVADLAQSDPGPRRQPIPALALSAFRVGIAIPAILLAPVIDKWARRQSRLWPWEAFRSSRQLSGAWHSSAGPQCD